jgi:hypothetical protein
VPQEGAFETRPYMGLDRIFRQDEAIDTRGRAAPQATRQPWRIPGVVGIVDGSRREVIGMEPATNTGLKATNAKGANIHSRSTPYGVVNHVVFPTSSMTAAALAGARRRVDTAVLAQAASGHECSDIDRRSHEVESTHASTTMMQKISAPSGTLLETANHAGVLFLLVFRP